VPITHGNTAAYFDVLDERYDFSPADVFSHTFDLVFDCAMFDLFGAWGVGASVVSVPPVAYRDLRSFAAEQGLTVWFSTPSSIDLVRRLGGMAPGALPTLRRSLFAGEALRCRDAADWQAAAPGSTVENLYGPTELTISISHHRWDPERSPDLGVHGGIPIGAVHPGHAHLLLGPDGLPCAEDKGELCVAGPQLMPGYLDPEDDRGRFLRHDGRVWYRTGDRVLRRAGGELAYLGRMDAQVQVQGWRVELAEIDHALAACTGVDQAVAVDVTERGGTTGLVAFYTGTRVPPAELARELRALLPDKLVPRRFEHLADLPLNANRKINRSALRERAATHR
jgi:non-ribosomal peptide synthetase component F